MSKIADVDMPVLTHEEVLRRLENVPTVEYPEEVLQRLDREYLVLKAQMASGEVKPMTVEEIAAEYGISLDELDDLDDEEEYDADS